MFHVYNEVSVTPFQCLIVSSVLYRASKFTKNAIFGLVTKTFSPYSREQKRSLLTFKDRTIMDDPLIVLCPCRNLFIFDVQFVNQDKVFFFRDLSSQIPSSFNLWFLLLHLVFLYKSSTYTTIMTNPLFVCV